MRIIYNIMRTELRTLFYSPIAWFILIVFVFQSGMLFSGMFGYYVRDKALGYDLYNLTLKLFSGHHSLFASIQQYVYLYIPLLTMSLMTRETGSGSIKLLYSSPVSNLQIVLGKYAAVLACVLLMTCVLGAYGLFTVCTVCMADATAILAGLLGIFLLAATYGAIGLFMSSLTNYPVVAAMGTLSTLFVLNRLGGVWQEISFVRDLTYWLCISGRANELISGLVCSEDVIYFLLVIGLFLSLTVVKIQTVRKRASSGRTMLKCLGILSLVLLLGYTSSRPVLMGFYDATRMKDRTLTPSSQKILAQLDENLTITAYTNLLDRHYYLTLPFRINEDKEQFQQYTRFKPRIRMNYVYYYKDAGYEYLTERYPGLSDKDRGKAWAKRQNLDFDMFQPFEEMPKDIDFESEGYRFIRVLERENGEKTVLRIFDDRMCEPSDAEITAAFKRLLMKLPTVGFLTGHGERSIRNGHGSGYRRFAYDKHFRYALINQGFDICEVTLDKAIPEDVSILVIADPKQKLTEEENAVLDRYIAGGGNMLIAGEPRRAGILEELTGKVGIRFIPGTLVADSSLYTPDLLIAGPTEITPKYSSVFTEMLDYNRIVTMPGCAGLEGTGAHGFKATPLFRTSTTEYWNECETRNFVDDTLTCNAEKGEAKQSYPTVMAVSRKLGDKEQRIVVLGDADCISTGEISMERSGFIAENQHLIAGSFFWLSNGEVPIDMSRPIAPDRDIFISEKAAAAWGFIFTWGIPFVLLIISLMIWYRRGRR